MTKQCFKCLATKPLDEFYRHSRMADGRLNKCKVCTKKDVAGNRADHLEYYRAYDRVRYYDEGPRGTPSAEVRRRAGDAWDDRNQHKKTAHTAVGNAVRDGKLVKPSRCDECKATTESRLLHGHHEDYSAPLDVRWLCATCHGRHHRQYDEGETRSLVAARRETL